MVLRTKKPHKTGNAFVIKTNRAERVLLLPGGELHCRFIWNEFK